MKRSILSFILLLAMGAICAENGNGTLTVTSVESTPVTGITVITYDLQTALMPAPPKANTTYNISVAVSFDNGATYFDVDPSHLEGDVTDVSPGEDKVITWDGGAGFPNRYSEETRVRLTATPVDDVFVCGESTVTFTYNGEEVTYGTVWRNGLCWLDRNLGADPMPFVPADDATGNTDTRLYGDLFQWGRGDDGHQDRDSDNYERNQITPGLFHKSTSGSWCSITTPTAPGLYFSMILTNGRRSSLTRIPASSSCWIFTIDRSSSSVI